MKLLAATILFFVVSLLYFSAGAQEENWETYMAQFDKKPGSILVNLALITRAPDKRFPYLVVTGPIAKQCNADGLPATSEIPDLEEVLSATDDFLTGITPKVLAGTFTHNCQRLNYYYVKDTMGIRFAIGRLYTQNYKDFKYAISIRPDPEWRAYRTFLYPDEPTFNWIENNKIITGMLQRGDDLSTQKEISFTLYFKTEDQRKEFMAFVHSRGYNVKEENYLKGDAIPYELKFSKYNYVKNDIIAEMSAEIKKEAGKYSVTYNGWEAQSIK